MSIKHLPLLAVFALTSVSFSVGCSRGPSAPSDPSIAQVAGVWAGVVLQTSVTGGECVSLFANGSVDRYTFTIAQSGSSLTATASSQATGQSCMYSGTAGSNTVSLEATNCTPGGFMVTCNGAPRDVYVTSRRFAGTVGGNTMSGTTGENWNVFVGGTTTDLLGIVAVNRSFTLAR